MGCTKCPEKEPRPMNVDKHGNPLPKTTSLGQDEAKKHAHINKHEAHNLSYKDYLRMRSEWRAESKMIGQERIQAFSDDYKRIQIDELVSVFNLDEVHFKLTPTQALAALYEFTQRQEYDKIFAEFDNLKEQIVDKYNELTKNRIVVKWEPNFTT